MLLGAHADFLDTQEGLERIRGNVKVYCRVLDSFCTQDMLTRLLGQMELQQVAEAGRTAHAIRGTAGNLSMPALYEAASELERQLAGGETEKVNLQGFADIYEKTTKVVEYTLLQLVDGGS